MTLSIVRDTSDQAAELGVARRPFRLIELSELGNLPKPVCLVENLIPDYGLTFLNGAPGAGKSFLALDLALSVATSSGTWFGRALRGGPVVYAVGEGLSSIQRRVQAWAWAHPDAGEGHSVAFCDGLPNLCDPSSVNAFILAVADRPVPMPALLVLDTFSRAIAGADENAAQEMSLAVASLDYLRAELNCALVAIHHTGKNSSNGMRGSSVLSAAADAELRLEHLEGLRELRPTKMRDGSIDQRLTFRLVPALGSAHLALAEGETVSRPLTDSQEAALRALRGLPRPAKATAWLEASGLAKRTFYAAIPALLAAGRVLDTPRGYVLAEVQGAE